MISSPPPILIFDTQQITHTVGVSLAAGKIRLAHAQRADPRSCPTY